ncbi:hypothetical protein KUTeg_006537, partial [Tegillarca granosa]
MMGPKLLRPIDPYSVTDSIDLPVDMMLDVTDCKNRNVGLSDVSVECYSNAILAWGMNHALFRELEISFAELVPGMGNTSMEYFRIGNDRNRRVALASVKKSVPRTTVIGTIRSDGAIGKPKSGYVRAENDTCVDATLCTSGLRVLGNRCVDVDECAEGTATCKNGCRNVYGGYECNREVSVSREDCPFGTRFDNDTSTCEDIDECAEGTATCKNGCRNVYGGYECNREVSVSRENCPFGTRFDNDTSTCEDIDECAEGTATCKNGCRNVYGGYECNREVSVSREDCPFGTRFDNVTLTCEDIDECALNTDTCDPLSTDCTNTEGGFECVCKDPSLSLMPSLTSCEKSKYEFRLLDFNKMRCCKHGSGDSAFLVRGRLGGLHSRYSEITPVACIEVTDVDYTRIPWTYAKPYVVSGMGENEVETLLNLVDFVRETKREERTLVELVYKDGCRQTFALGNGNDRTEPPLPPPKYYISYTPVTYTYYDPKHRSFDKCRRKVAWGMNNVLFRELEISFAELVPGMEKTSMEYFRIGNDRNRKLDTRKCKKVGSADDCYWYDSFRRCDRENKVCGRTGAENDTLSVGCKCRSGYALAEDDTCVDTTLCIPGLRVLRNQCVDIDECAEGTATCQTGCRNVYGGYECVSREDCPFGTRFDNDTLTCEDIDECALNTDTCDPLSTDCRNIEGGFECVCKDPSLSLMPSLTSCRKSKYEFRLLDFDKMRCCKHGSGGSAFLVRGRLGGLHSRYSEITPVACIEVTDVDFTRIPWTYTKPYVVSGMGENEVETLLNLVDFVRETKREERTLVELVYKDGCRQTFALGNGNNRTEPPQPPPKYYISYTPVTYTYFDPKNQSFDKCRRKV